MVLRSLTLIAAAAVFAAGCAAGPQAEPAPETGSSSTVTTTVASVTTDDAEAALTPDPTTTTAVPAPAIIVDGPPAPDFTLALETGGEFTLSEEQKPVYLVFWAEW